MTRSEVGDNDHTEVKSIYYVTILVAGIIVIW
jgi:hypothetical protein